MHQWREFFSQMNVVHSKLRNRLYVRSVEAILQIRYGLKLEAKSCVSFTPSNEMLKRFGAKDDHNDADKSNDDLSEDVLISIYE